MDNPVILAALEKIDKEKDFLQSISLDIWSHPELMFEEHFAHNLLSSALESQGFLVQREYLLPTAFRAEFTTGKEGATVAILCEYDALEDIGHACGHNLIAEAGLAAGMGVKAAMEMDPTIGGKLVVMGTPAEEGGSGKVKLIDKGAFADIDVCMMVHPTTINYADFKSTANKEIIVQYKGKETHAAARPWIGVNALDAAVIGYCNISHLRQQIRPECRVHGIITKGGKSPNVIPEETELRFWIRAPTSRELERLEKRVLACFKSAADGTGCTVKFEVTKESKEMISNSEMTSLFVKYRQLIGNTVEVVSSPETDAGSTDLGNVSHIVPCIHPFYAIPTSGFNHNKGFTASVGCPEAQGPTLVSAKAMALTALDILRSPSCLEKIKRKFKEDVTAHKL